MKQSRGRFVVLKHYDDTGHESVLGEYHDRQRAIDAAHQAQRRANIAGHAATYRVIEAVPDPLAVLRRRVTT